jgi:hypothetical protein
MEQNPRRCKGCKEPLPAHSGQGRGREWCSEACRSRSRRRGASGNGHVGRARAGLEMWAAKHAGEPPEVLLSAARQLADEVDREPQSSPLWGRYLQCLQQLAQPEIEANQIQGEMREICEHLATIEAAEQWRVTKLREAMDRGENWQRWGRLVPVGCAQGRHAWHQWGGFESPKACKDCYGRLENDGTVSWPPDNWSMSMDGDSR